jgi:hypothetical protein
MAFVKGRLNGGFGENQSHLKTSRKQNRFRSYNGER